VTDKALEVANEIIAEVHRQMTSEGVHLTRLATKVVAIVDKHDEATPLTDYQEIVRLRTKLGEYMREVEAWRVVMPQYEFRDEGIHRKPETLPPSERGPVN
jgi:hypothetical protein